MQKNTEPFGHVVMQDNMTNESHMFFSSGAARSRDKLEL